MDRDGGYDKVGDIDDDYVAFMCTNLRSRKLAVHQNHCFGMVKPGHVCIIDLRTRTCTQCMSTREDTSLLASSSKLFMRGLMF